MTQDKTYLMKQPHIFLYRMNEARWAAAGAHHPQLGFLVSGGWYGNRLATTTTEISKDGRTFSTYTPLPYELHGHCMIALDGDDGEFFFAGGSKGGQLQNRAFIHRGGQWVEVERMRRERVCKKSDSLMQIKMN